MKKRKVIHKMEENDESFMDKIKHTRFFEKNALEVMFNLYLVLRGERPAWFFEIKNTEDELFLKEIMAIFNDEIEDTPINSTATGILIHLKTTKIPTPPNDASLWHVWLGKVLGFFCPHDIRESYILENRYVINYYINGQQFYAEVCTENLAKESNMFDESKLRQKRWQDIATDLSNCETNIDDATLNGDCKLKYNVTMDIKISYSRMYWYNIITSKNFEEIMSHRHDFNIQIMNSFLPFKFIRDMGFINFKDPSNEMTVKEFEANLNKYYNWVLISILIDMKSDEILKCFNKNEISDVAKHIYNHNNLSKMYPSAYLVELMKFCDDEDINTKEIIKNIFIDYKRFKH